MEFGEDGEANFWLGNIPEGCDYDITLYDEYGVDDDRIAKSWNLDNEQELITVDVEADVTYYLKIDSVDGCSDDYYLFRTKNYPYPDEDEDEYYVEDDFEPNNDFTDPDLPELSRNDYLYATIHDPDDEDIYSFYLNDVYEVTIDLLDIPYGCDYDLELYDDNLEIIEISAAQNDDPERINVILDRGWYYIHVYPYRGAYSADEYFLEIYSEESSLENSKAIVVIPGIMGSELENIEGDLLWLDLVDFIANIFDYSEQLRFFTNGESVNDIHVVNEGYGTLDIYENLYVSLSDEFASEYDVIFFPYDWRYSCNYAANLLSEILMPYQEVILVAHSMGGLVASQYITFSSSTMNKVDKLITLGTPFTGAPKALHVMETGAPFEIIEGITELINLNTMVYNYPSIYELLPNERYFDEYYSFIKVGSSSLTTYSDSLNFMETREWGILYDDVPKQLFEDASDFHNSLILYDEHIANTSNVDSYIIYSNGTQTIGGVNYTSDGIFDDLTPTYSGDGTVPLYSATNNNLTSSSIVYEFEDISHIGLASDNDVIGLVIDIINGDNIIISSDQNQNKLNTNNIGKEDRFVNIISDNVKNIMISLNGKPIYNSGEKMYYIDGSGNEIDVGRKWYLGEERYQYSLVEGNYDVDLEYYEDVVSKLKISTTKDGENTTIGEYSVDSQLNDNINFSLTEIDSRPRKILCKS